MLEIQDLEDKIKLARFYDDEYGFAAFYELLYGRELPKHAFVWIQKIYKAARAKRGIVIEAYRGSTKTTTITVAFTTFQIGHNPWDSFMFIQASDESAEKKAKEVAGLIKNNPAFKAVFPWVKPDEDISWADHGYEILSEMVKAPDESEVGFAWQPIKYEDFRRLKASTTQDPTFIGLGLTSSAIIGKHPTGMLVMDDIHDEKNTRSPREMETVKDVLESTILPITTTPSGGTRFIIVVGTPWKYNDAFATMKEKPGYDHAYTPIIVDGKSTWPEAFSLEWIDNKRANTPEIEFARMYLLDLTAAEGIHLKGEWLSTYPHDKIQSSWPVIMGIDYASTADQWETKGRERDYFALAIGRLIPGNGGVVLTDGIRMHMSQGESETRVKAIAGTFPTLQLIGVEALGKGEEFYHLLLRTTKLPIMPMRTNKGKGERFERQMAPMFQFGRAFVSDRPNEFLDHFRREWIQWPNGTHDDVLDSVYWMLQIGKFNLYGVPDDTPMSVINPMFDKPKRPNPAILFGRK